MVIPGCHQIAKEDAYLNKATFAVGQCLLHRRHLQVQSTISMLLLFASLQALGQALGVCLTMCTVGQCVAEGMPIDINENLQPICSISTRVCKCVPSGLLLDGQKACVPSLRP